MSASAAYELNQSLSAEIVAGGRAAALATTAAVHYVGRRTLLLDAAAGLAPGAHAWVALTLPGGAAVRPLVEVTGPAEGGVACRIVHLFPDQRRAFEAWHQTRATPAGY